ncbi:MAG: glycosyltransferase, partial [Lachnospiraceae bacterium]|nr:glycosyltransferase [Lachnospiraceae bacterium]
MALISVIIPVYNAENTLHQCIDSVLNQTKKNLEIILVDDGSTDQSGMICDEYVDKNDNIICIHKKNGGVSSARNEGLKKVTGEYVCFLDSDDYWDEDILEYLYELLIKTNSDYAKCAARLIGWPTAIITEHSEDDYSVYNQKEMLKYTLLGVNGFTGGATHSLFKSELVKDNLFLEIRSNEDLDFVVRCEMNFNRAVISKCLKYNY